jgi:hypothetical protein
MRYDDGIAIVSLESACVMRFSRAEPASDTPKQGGSASESTAEVPILLNPGSGAHV